MPVIPTVIPIKKLILALGIVRKPTVWVFIPSEYPGIHHDMTLASLPACAQRHDNTLVHPTLSTLRIRTAVQTISIDSTIWLASGSAPPHLQQSCIPRCICTPTQAQKVDHLQVHGQPLQGHVSFSLRRLGLTFHSRQGSLIMILL